MIVMLGAMFKYTWRPKLYLWIHEEQKQTSPKIELGTAKQQSKNPLKKLLLRLNTSRGAVPGREKNAPEITQSAPKTAVKDLPKSMMVKNA